MRRRWLITLAAGVIAAAGCSSKPITLSTPAPRAQPTTAAQAACPFTLTRVNDLRSDRTSLGAIGLRTIEATDFADWLRNRVIGLAGYTESPAPFAIEVDLLKAYMQSVATMKSANVVVRVRFLKGEAVLSEQVYRGADDTMNWVNGTNESRHAFEKALNSVAQSIREGLAAACGQGKEAS